MPFLPNWAPGVHPALVHFPIALLIAAVAADLCALLFPRLTSSSAAASFLYPAGAVSAIAAYLTGRQSAATALLSGMAHPIVRDHWNLALATTLCFSAIALLRLFMTWRKSTARWVRPTLMICALLGLVLLFYTGEQGARLVFEQGVGVRVPATRR
jgi:uncharacterized membrane protein